MGSFLLCGQVPEKRRIQMNFEKQFTEGANKRAMRMWLVISIVLTAAYVIELVKEQEPYRILLFLRVFVGYRSSLVLFI